MKIRSIFILICEKTKREGEREGKKGEFVQRENGQKIIIYTHHCF